MSIEWPDERRLARRAIAMRGKGLWLSTKATFAPADVAASLGLIVLVLVFTLVYLAYRTVLVTDSAPPVAASQTSKLAQIAPTTSPGRRPATNSGLGTIIQAVTRTTNRPRPTGLSTASPSPSPSKGEIPFSSPTPSPTDSATPTPTPTPSPTDSATP